MDAAYNNNSYIISFAEFVVHIYGLGSIIERAKCVFTTYPLTHTHTFLHLIETNARPLKISLLMYMVEAIVLEYNQNGEPSSCELCKFLICKMWEDLKFKIQYSILFDMDMLGSRIWIFKLGMCMCVKFGTKQTIGFSYVKNGLLYFNLVFQIVV